MLSDGLWKMERGMRSNLNEDGQIDHLDLKEAISMPYICRSGGLGNDIMLHDELPELIADDGVNFL